LTIFLRLLDANFSAYTYEELRVLAKTLKNNGKNCQPQLVGAGFLNQEQTVSVLWDLLIVGDLISFHGVHDNISAT